ASSIWLLFFLLECDSKLTHYHPNWLNFNSDNYPARGGKLWVVKDTSGSIKGHIDLRHHSDESRSHRVLLGMGVDVSCRKQGLGQRLIDAVINFCQEKAEIDWLDLCVLSENFPAKNLYLKAGFNVVGEFKDQYRIDGLSVSETAMTKCVKNYA
ncbi:N-acetyltransferase, partial [Vibrio vulnificus]|uniref:GNAT family N-acetyltransferase n=1 Tax=Vibrio vulnificus TaxID=672 RepID=UPI004059B953